MEKPNCHQCIHRGSIPGDAHLCCRHPAIPKHDLMMGLMMIIAGDPGVQIAMQKLNIRIDEYGFRQGWAYWPYNFDSTWINNCDGYEPTKAS